MQEGSRLLNVSQKKLKVKEKQSVLYHACLALLKHAKMRNE